MIEGGKNKNKTWSHKQEAQIVLFIWKLSDTLLSSVAYYFVATCRFCVWILSEAAFV